MLTSEKMPPAYGLPGGPWMVLTHSYKLSPLGPAEQFDGGSRLISASSFWILRVCEERIVEKGHAMPIKTSFKRQKEATYLRTVGLGPVLFRPFFPTGVLVEVDVDVDGLLTLLFE